MHCTHVYRQGDVIFIQIPGSTNVAGFQTDLKTGAAKKLKTRLIQKGENGGVHELVKDHTATFVEYEAEGERYILAPEGVTVVHREHGPVDLPKGNYEVRIQREWIGRNDRQVRD